MMVPIKISVIIPTFNAFEFLEKLVNSLEDQHQKVDQIIIIDSGSEDGTYELASKLVSKVIGINPDDYDHGSTRNLAAKQANGNILVFMTQDALPVNRDTIGRLIEPLEEELTVVSYARQVPKVGASTSEKYLRLTNYPFESLLKNKTVIKEMGIKAFQSSNVCAAYRRIEFEKLGYFPAPAVCNEDMIFAAKAIFSGYQVSYSADAVVEHSHDLSTKILFKRYFDIAASLDYEPRIKCLGQAEAKGLDFVKNQLKYLKDQHKHYEMPRAICETAAKYIGYKCGVNHNRIPRKLKKYLGLNRVYWRKVE